jgi:hypothetical protein
MASIAEIRSQFPQYADVSDAQLADAIHAKFYADMPKAEFDAKVLETKQANLEAGRHESLLNPQANERNIPAVLGQSAIKGVANIGDFALGAPQNLSRIAAYTVGKLAGKDVDYPRYATPVTNQLVQHDILKPENEPNTPLLKTADFAVQSAVPGTLFSKARTLPTVAKNVAENLAQGVIGGATTELGKASGFQNPLAEQLIAGTSMAIPGSIYAMRNTPSTVVNQAMRNMTSEQLSAAQNLVDRSYLSGSPITGAEAITQVMGSSKLPSIQRYVENQPRGEGASIMGDFMANRPSANRTMVGNALNEISPNVPSSTTPGRLQTSAAKLLRGAEKGVTESVNPLYERGVNEMQNLTEGKVLPIMPNEVNKLTQNPAIADAIGHVTSNAYTGVKGMPANDPRVLQAAKVYLDAQYGNFSNPMAGSLDKAKAANAWSGSRELDSYLSSKSPSYAQGSKNFENAQNREINPIRQGIVGSIANATGIPEELMAQQSRVLTPNAPKATTPADITRTVDLLRRKDPTIAADWTRQNLEGIFNETTQSMQGKQNQFGGAKFASTITGNEAQKNNLKALVEASSGKGTWEGFNNMLEVLQAQGQRMPANSATAFNNILTQEMESGGKGAFLKLPVSIPTMIREGVQAWELGKNTEMLAKMLTDPKSVEKLNELAKTKPNSAKARNIVNSIAGGYVGQKPELATEENK